MCIITYDVWWDLWCDRIIYKFVELCTTQIDYKIHLMLEALANSLCLFRSNMHNKLEIVAYSNWAQLKKKPKFEVMFEHDAFKTSNHFLINGCGHYPFFWRWGSNSFLSWLHKFKTWKLAQQCLVKLTQYSLLNLPWW